MTLKEKQRLIHEIVESLRKLHFANLIQQNLHGGNILINYHEQGIPIDDDSLRPNIVVNGIPKCFIELMKKCWDNCSKNRPTIEEILTMLDRWHLLLDDATILTSSSEVFKSDNSSSIIITFTPIEMILLLVKDGN
nr:5874_t:CDS:2 [Entrophospora candida]